MAISFTKFANPHLHAFSEIVTVDRVNLDHYHRDDGSESGSEQDDNAAQPDVELLDELVAASIELPPSTTNELSAEDKAARKRKMKKERQKLKKDELKPVQFRLFPGPPTALVLRQGGGGGGGHPLIRPAEDTEQESQVRSERASTAGVIVEWEDLVKERGVFWPPRKPSEELRIVNHRGLQDAGLLLHKDPQVLPTLAVTARMKRERAPTPPNNMADPPVFCSILDVESLHAQHSRNTKQARVPGSTTTHHPTPAFFRPDPSAGLKAAGYGYGYHPRRRQRQQGVTDRRTSADDGKFNDVERKRLVWRYGQDDRLLGCDLAMSS